MSYGFIFISIIKNTCGNEKIPKSPRWGVKKMQLNDSKDCLIISQLFKWFGDIKGNIKNIVKHSITLVLLL